MSRRSPNQSGCKIYAGHTKAHKQKHKLKKKKEEEIVRSSGEDGRDKDDNGKPSFLLLFFKPRFSVSVQPQIMLETPKLFSVRTKLLRSDQNQEHLL